MGSLHWRQKVATSFLYATRVTLNQRIKYAANTRKTTGQQVSEYCAARGLAHDKIVVPMPTTSSFPPPNLHLVSYPDSVANGPTVLFVHGGGYLYPMVGECHIPLALHMGRSSKAKQVAYLEYTLTSSLQYPGQLAQIAQAVAHLLKQGVRLSDLIFAGDSAGGHLVAGLIAHMQQPCPLVEPINLKGQQIRAVVLLSPWVDMTLTDACGTANEAYDVLSQGQLRDCGRLLGATSRRDSLWLEPLRAREGKTVLVQALTGAGGGAEPIAGRVLITAGEREVLFESCVEFAENFAEARTVVMNAKGRRTIQDVVEQEACVFAVGPGEVHVQSGIDVATGYYEGGTMFALTKFLEAL